MSNVRNAVAVRDQAVAEVVERPSLRTLARLAIERQAITLTKVMPPGLTLDRFESITLAEIRSTPKLLRCFETPEGEVSLLYSVVSAAAAGLEVGGLNPEAHLIPYEKRYKDERDRWCGRWEARLQINDRGVRALGRRDPRVKDLVADVVREGDHFVHRRTLDGDVFEHEVRGPSDRPMTHAYCLILWKDGGGHAIVLDRVEVEGIRDRYSEGYRADLEKSADKQSNMWIVRPAKAWAKTAVHQARRELDLTPEVEAALALATGPDEVAPELPSLDAETWKLDTQLATELEALPPANEDGEPIRQVNDDLRSYAPNASPEAEAFNEPPAPITLDDLVKAGFVAGHWDGKTGLGLIRKRLVALATNVCGTDPAATPEQIVADEVAAEQLLVALQAEAEARANG